MAGAGALNVRNAIEDLCCYHAAGVRTVIGKAATK
jgi:hypothetical protein